MKMATTNLAAAPELPEKTIPEEFFKALSAFNIQAASNIVWEHISAADRIIQEKEPFKLVKTDKEQALEIIKDLCVRLYTIGRMLNPIMPNTSEIIKKLVKENKMPDAPLFVRK
jgi:methionyl-tRNA synthetase